MSEDIFHTEQDKQFKHHCGECVMFEDDGVLPYCLAKDLYTEADMNDEACEYFVINNADSD